MHKKHLLSLNSIFLIFLACLGGHQSLTMHRPPSRMHRIAAPRATAIVRSYSAAPRQLGPLQQLEQYQHEASEQEQKALESVKDWKKVMQDCANKGCSKNCKPYFDCVWQHDEHLTIFKAAHDKRLEWAQKARKLQEYMKQ